MRIVHPEYGDITEEVEKVFREGLYQQEIAAIKRQREINRVLGAAKVNPKWGQPVARLDPVIYHHWEKVAGRGCWADRSERNSILKFAPELAPPVEKNMNRIGGSASFAKAWDKRFSQGAVILEGKAPQDPDAHRLIKPAH